jgi:hypothetical protein
MDLMGSYPFIHTLIPAADEDKLISPGQLPGHGLIKGLALGREQYNKGGAIHPVHGFQCANYGARFHDHAAAPPIGTIIRHIVGSSGKGPDVCQSHIHQSLFYGTS